MAYRAFSSAETFLFCYAEDKNFDLLLFDVEMPGTDGPDCELWNAQAQYDTKEPAEKTGGSLHKIPTKKLYVPPKSGANCELFGRTA